MKLLTLFKACKLRAESLHNFNVIACFIFSDHNKSMCVGLFEQVFGFIYFIRRIYRDKHCADFNRCPKCYIPCRDIRCPYCDMISRFYTKREQRTCKGINIVSEFTVCSCVIKSCISETVSESAASIPS